MSTPFMIDVISRIVHVSTAIALLGGTTFILFVLHPSISKIIDAEQNKLREQIIDRWKRFVHIGTALFLVTGFYNFIRAIPNHKGDGLYHALIGTKILMALAIFFIGAVLVGRSPKFESMRKNRQLWLTVVVMLGFAIVAISGFAKVRGPKPATATVPISQTAN